MIWTTRPRSEGPGSLAFLRDGDGPPLVLIHGVGLRAEAWAAMTPALARDHAVFAVDMPGHGASPLGGARTLADYVARVVDFIAALDEPVRLAGHSMGAMIALEAAIRRPDLICAVAALNAIHRRSAAASSAVKARAAALEQRAAPSPAPTLERWFGPAPTGARGEAAAACGAWLTGADPAGYARAYAVFAAEDGPADADLARLTAPALFLTGALDPNSTPAMSKAMAALAPKGRAAAIADAAHMAPMTHGAEICAALAATFAAAATTAADPSPPPGPAPTAGTPR